MIINMVHLLLTNLPMIRRLIILLLIVGCDNSTEPEEVLGICAFLHRTLIETSDPLEAWPTILDNFTCYNKIYTKKECYDIDYEGEFQYFYFEDANGQYKIHSYSANYYDDKTCIEFCDDTPSTTVFCTIKD